MDHAVGSGTNFLQLTLPDALIVALDELVRDQEDDRCVELARCQIDQRPQDVEILQEVDQEDDVPIKHQRPP